MDFLQSGFALFGKKWDVTAAVRKWYTKSLGFVLFAIKSHRLCSFWENGTQGAKKQKAGLIPEYPDLHTAKFI
jgi:hypothetical protein